jgi:hypothetical protein
VHSTVSLTWDRLLRTAVQFSTAHEPLAHGAGQDLRVSYQGV